jgi:hypothetical protein
VRFWIALSLGVALASIDAGAQAPPQVSTPLVSSWPRVVADVRATTTGVPSEIGFYPTLPFDVLVPARAFGADLGAHVYAGRLGPGRLGFGGSVILARATQAESVVMRALLVAPQVSLNFGSPRGWSYVSGGAGVSRMTGRFRDGDGVTTERSSGTLSAINFGGGARWFISSRLAFTFDLRLHRIGGTTGSDGVSTSTATLGSASVGLSVR